jgi:hypothetical protein
MPVIRGSSGGLYGDASSRTADIRRQSVLKLQLAKTGNPADLSQVLSNVNQAKKPLISERHLTKGSTNGSMEFLQIKNPYGFF